MKLKNQKFINRTASIISRSKLLILSDSESDDDIGLDKKSFSKYLRISKKFGSWKTKDHSKLMSKGKRKRNSGSDVFASTSSIQTVISSKNLKTKSDSMEIETSSSELSDDCPTDGNFDGDDEQSDFYDSNIKTTSKNRIYCHSKPKLEFKIPSKPANRFFSFDFESHPSINLWKRRRPTH